MISKPKTTTKFVTIGTGQHRKYEAISNNNESLNVLARFLISEIYNSGSYPYFMNWLMGRYTQEWATGNAFHLLNEKDDIVIYSIAHCIDSEENEFEELYYKNVPDIVYFTIIRKQLIEVIEKWVDLICQENQPDKITITQDEKGNVEIIPHAD